MIDHSVDQGTQRLHPTELFGLDREPCPAKLLELFEPEESL
jgi:hypothetical protein